MIGKPDSGKPTVRFDEGELEIGPKVTTPVLYSTGINNFRTSDSTERTSAVQFATNAIFGFVPSSISSRKKQIQVFKGQVFVSI